MDKWAELRTAYQVAKRGTVSAAAQALGFHRATVNRHIDVLEAEIGAPVFIRHARGYTLTETGEDVLRVAQKTEELMNDLAARVDGSKAALEGEIKLTLLAPFAGLLMEPVATFRTENPKCLVSIDASEDLARLEYGEAHIALRAGPKPDHPDYVVKSFGRVGFNLYAHDRYVQTYGLPKSVDDFDGHQFVVPGDPEGRVPFRAWINDHITHDRIAVSSRSIWVTVEAIAAGIGMGFVSDHEARVRGDFHRVLAPNRAWSVPLWVVTHVDLHRTEKVQAMVRCIHGARKKETNASK